MRGRLFGIGVASALVLVPATTAAASARPLTTAPPQVVTIKITITDNAVRMLPKSAPRGDVARFVIVNTGRKHHVFSLGHQRRQTGTQTGFTKALDAGEQSILILFLDYRGLLPYLGSLPEDRVKPAMRGTFKIF